jgi:hypothetical protein
MRAIAYNLKEDNKNECALANHDAMQAKFLLWYPITISLILVASDESLVSYS